jgi:anti-anti-sigma factor
MEIDCKITEEGVCIVALIGRMHLKDLQEIEARLKGLLQGQRSVVVDLSRLDCLFSMCLRTLILCSQSVELRGGRLVLLATTENILAVLRASGVIKMLHVFREQSEAEAAALAYGGD